MNAYSATDNYLSLLLSLPQLQPITVLATFFLTLGRILPIISLAPFFGTKNVPGTIRILFGIALVAIFLPANLLHMTKEIPFNYAFIGFLLKEVIIGFILGFLATIPFFIAQMTGNLIDFQRGAASLQISDPTTHSQTSPIGLLLNLLLIALFFSLDGPFLYINGVADSYQIIPVDAIFATSAFSAQVPFWKQTIGLAGMMMTIATQLSAPALIGILLTDLFLGIANRLAPQVQIVFLGIALKSWVGIALMTAAWALMLQIMSKEATSWMQTIHALIRQMGSYAPS